MHAPAPIVVCTGMPGVGKTTLAVGLATALCERGVPVLVVHTDVLKVTARALSDGAPVGAGYAGDVAAKAAWMNELLAAQVDKARADGYGLVIEGTLAVAFDPPDAIQLRLELDDPERARRVARKHPSAAAALAGADLTPYAAALAASFGPRTTRLDASAPVPVVVARALERVLSP